jgi:hypothetical protein
MADTWTNIYGNFDHHQMVYMRWIQAAGRSRGMSKTERNRRYRARKARKLFEARIDAEEAEKERFEKYGPTVNKKSKYFRFLIRRK